VSSQSLSNTLLAALNSGGLKRFFIAPGSRSQALAIAAAKLETSDKATTHVRLDERSLAFTALGTALATKEPAAVIVTSGTAAGNLLPATLEAHHSGVPLILITADRPARLRAAGANQTLDNQAGLFGFAAKSLELEVDATESEILQVATEALACSGPVQINVQFDLPLSDGSLQVPVIRLEHQPEDTELTKLSVPVDESTVVIAGAGGGAARAFAEAANLPLLAEPSSGARSGSHALQFPLKALEKVQGKISRVVVFGKPTLSRPIQRLISESEVWVERSADYGNFDPHQNVKFAADRLIPSGRAGDAWLQSFQVEYQLDEREQFVSWVWNSSERLVLGASELIRELDRVAPPRDLEIYSNRGLAGIDGTVSTALGIALSKGETTLLVGDLTLLHDAGGLNLSDLGQLPLRIVVGNDNGGRIFSGLEVASEISGASFERLFTTPQQVDLAALAAAYGWKYERCNSLAQLTQAWKLSGPALIAYQL